MSLSSSFKISGSALTAQRLRMDVIAGNIANATTTRSSDGGPYKRRQVVLREMPTFQTVSSALRGEGTSVGVQVAGITASDGVRMVNDPSHPDANADGFVAYPDIDLAEELTNMMSAQRAYEASVTTASAAKAMAMKALELGRG
jgi:flagellar basal-body rod protein FlgC